MAIMLAVTLPPWHHSRRRMEPTIAVFNPPPEFFVPFDTLDAPHLMVIVDTEEEFSWDSFSRNANGVLNIAHQHRAQAIFERYKIVPTYVVDYPVASQRDGISPLKEMLDSEGCRIGAQLHAWVTPPMTEEVTKRNTYQRNLPVELERAKIAALTAIIEDNFGVRPEVFKAGRNGIGPHTATALVEHGYTIDNSVLPYADISPDGPDFTGCPSAPFWLDQEKRILEIPMTVGLTGLLQGIGGPAARSLFSSASTRFRVPGVLARSGLLERIRLTPEGVSIAEAKRLTRSLLERGQRLFVMCYHSSSLLPGSTPYVRNNGDLARFLAWLTDYVEFFFGDLGGRPISTDAVLSWARQHSSASK